MESLSRPLALVAVGSIDIVFGVVESGYMGSPEIDNRVVKHARPTVAVSGVRATLFGTESATGLTREVPELLYLNLFTESTGGALMSLSRLLFNASTENRLETRAKRVSNSVDVEA